MSTLEIKGLVASVAGKQILNGIDLTVRSAEVHAIMGPNGAGKSTLSAVIMGKPGYEVHAGEVLLDGVDLLALPAWQRAQAGMHLVMQYPSEVPGVGLVDMLSEAFTAASRPMALPARLPPRPSGSTFRRPCSIAHSMSICPAARRSAMRPCSSPC